MNQPQEAPSTPQGGEVAFEEPRQVLPCSFQECTAGHRWPLTLTLAPCPGCQAAVLAIQKTQCPYCNEPVLRSVLRSDFIHRGAGLSRRCMGQPGGGDSLTLEMERTSWREIEEAPKEPKECPAQQM